MNVSARRAFTLIELLVVVAVVAMLIAILLPALFQARTVSRSVACGSNIRQTVVGFNYYATDNRDVAVPGRMSKTGGSSDPRNMYWVGNGMQYRPRWFITIGAAAGFYAYGEPSTDPSDDNTKLIENDVFTCPEVSDRVNNRNAPFGYNYQFLGNSRRKASGAFINYTVRVSSIRAAGDTVLFADAMGTAAGKPAADRTPYEVDGSIKSNSAVGNHGWSLDPPRLVPGDSDFCDNGLRSAQHRSAPDPRHGGTASVAFTDSHVEQQSLEDLGYGVNDDGSVAIDGTGVTNRRFSGRGGDLDPPSIH